MNKSDAIRTLRRSVDSGKAELTSKGEGMYREYCEGRIAGMEAALYFLGEPQAVKEHEEAMEKFRKELAENEKEKI